MIKNQKGITLLTLTITIIVIMILSSVGTDVGLNMIRKANYYKAISELKAMQAKVNELYEEYKNDNTKVFGKDKNSKSENAYNHVITNLRNDIGDDLSDRIGLYEDYRLFDVDYIKNELDMEGIDLDFIVNVKTRMVILVDGVKGIEKDSQNKYPLYYALCEIEDEMYNVEYNETN